MKNDIFRVSGHEIHRSCWILLVLLCVSLFCTSSHAVESDLTESIKGVPRPTIIQLADGARCYAYKNFVVFAMPIKDSAGEDIVVYTRPRGVSDSQVSSPKNLTKYMEIKNAFSNYFAGLDREALFIISETGPDGVLKIYDLNRIKKVFESAYADGSLKIVHGDYLQLDKLLPTTVHQLNSSEAKTYPKVQKWLDQGGSAGWFVPVRISLATYAESSAGPRWLREMQ